MRTVTALAAACLGGLAASAPASAADAQHPAVVELYQSQGCNSCPPAIANLNALASRSDILALTFSVDYWDYLGWKDTFAKHKYTDRQWGYAHSLGHGQVYTPQVVVNGRVDGVGIDSGEIQGLIGKAGGAAAVEAHIAGDQLSIGAAQGKAHDADVWVAFYDPRTLEVAIPRGENAGHTIGHRNVVKEMVLAGHWNGVAETIDLPSAPQGLLRAVLVQSAGTGPILAAVRG